MPTPKDLAALPRQSPPPRPAPSQHPSVSEFFTALDDDLIDLVVKRVIASFRASATPDDVADLESARPSIPPDIDRALLRDTSDALRIDDLDESVRRRLRLRFWQLLDDEQPVAGR